MSVRLARLDFKPRGVSGWITPPLVFGAVLTILHGPNGSGKTPILKGLAFALGHPAKLPPDIVNHCESVCLTLSEGASRTTVERSIVDQFDCVVTDAQGNVSHFSDEKSFSAWIIGPLGIPERYLAARTGNPVPPYMSVLLPTFFVDQDLGWADIYRPISTHNFVNDQQSEVVRWMLGVPQKHRPVDNSAFARAKERLESVREQIAIRRNTIEALQSDVGPERGPAAREALLSRKNAVLEELRSHSSALESLAQSSSALDLRLAQLAQQREAARYAASTAERRLADIRRSGQEIEASIEVLEMNEVAADAFRILCGNESCQFFRRPEESYGRQLLYLKDQMKDFEVSSTSLALELDTLRTAVTEAEQRFQQALEEKQKVLAPTVGGAIVPIIEGITKELSDVSLRLDRAELIAREETRLNALIDLALKYEEEVRQLRPGRGAGGDITRLGDARAIFVSTVQGWLDILHAQNIPKPITVDDDLKISLGSERFSENSSQSGSTRTRIVLALHAALIETSLRTSGYHPGFLVLDTPRQHELHAEDLAAFVRRFQEMSRAETVPVQLIIAAKDQIVGVGGPNDEVFRPIYGSPEEPRYFGPGT